MIFDQYENQEDYHLGNPKQNTAIEFQKEKVFMTQDTTLLQITTGKIQKTLRKDYIKQCKMLIGIYNFLMLIIPTQEPYDHIIILYYSLLINLSLDKNEFQNFIILGLKEESCIKSYPELLDHSCREDPSVTLVCDLKTAGENLTYWKKNIFDQPVRENLQINIGNKKN